MTRTWARGILAAALAAVSALSAARADIVSVGALKDNTLFGDPGSAGSISDGAGPHLYIGNAAFGVNPRRGVIAFDFSSVPAGATINAATLTMNASRSVIASTTLSFNRILQDWGEGASNSGDPGGGGAPAAPGDATWLHTFFSNSFWTNPGGDFDPTPSGSFVVGAAALYSFSSVGMATDIANWLNNPASNFGWEMISDEATLTGAIRFDTRENSIAAVRPSLTIDYSLVVASGSWKTDGDGTYSQSTNWNGSVPSGAGAVATFGNVISAPRVVTIDAPVTVGTINFDSPFGYTLAGTSTLTIDSPTAGALSVLNGQHTISAALSLMKNTAVDVAGAGRLTISADLSAAPTVALTKTGAGTLAIKAARMDSLGINQGIVSILANGTDSATSKVKALNIAGSAGAWNGRLDLGNNAMVIDYTGGSPMGTVVNQLTVGYQGGAWLGNGIGSSAAAAASGSAHTTALAYAEATELFSTFPHDFHGQSVDGTSVLLLYTYSGDANLDRAVDSVDFNILAANFGSASAAWTRGDFNYDLSVDSVDFNLLASNFGQNLAGALSSSLVPEPAVAAWISALAGVMLARRRGNGSIRS
jgi:hypothetical protein